MNKFYTIHFHNLDKMEKSIGRYKPPNQLEVEGKLNRPIKKFNLGWGGARWRKSRVPKSPVSTKLPRKPSNYLKIYEFGLRFKERPAGMLQ